MIELVFLGSIHCSFFAWHSIIFIFDSRRNYGKIIDIFLCNRTTVYTCCEWSTKFFTLEERGIVNWFKFRMFSKIVWLVSIFYVKLVNIITEWTLLVVSSVWFYPFNITPMKLEIPIIPMIVSLTKSFFDAVLFDYLFSDQSPSLDRGFLEFIFLIYHFSPTDIIVVWYVVL